MASKKMSKTAASAVRAGSGRKGGFERAAGLPRIIPTGEGRKAYLFDDAGKTHHLAVGSETFMAVLADIVAGRDGNQVRDQVAECEDRWPGVGWAASLPVDETVDTDETVAA